MVLTCNGLAYDLGGAWQRTSGNEYLSGLPREHPYTIRRSYHSPSRSDTRCNVELRWQKSGSCWKIFFPNGYKNSSTQAQWNVC